MSDSNNYYALMSENSQGHGIFNEIELVKYYARKISCFCKDHRCATCPFHTPEGSCSFLRNSPSDWKGIENDDK